jgi:hypothetical protein
MIFLKPVLPTPFLPAILLAFLANAAHASPVDCGGVTLLDPQEKVALARVAATEARLNFIAGPGKRTPACPSAESACRLKAFIVAGDDVLVIAADGPYVCATFKSPGGIETSGWLPRAALQIAGPEPAPAQQWEGKGRRGGDAEILLKSHGDAVEVSGQASWGGSDPKRVKRGAINTGELAGEGKPRDQTLAIGYDPDGSGFPPAEDAADCAARLRLYGRYLAVEDNGACGGLNVRFTGVYVRAPSP